MQIISSGSQSICYWSILIAFGIHSCDPLKFRFAYESIAIQSSIFPPQASPKS